MAVLRMQIAFPSGWLRHRLAQPARVAHIMHRIRVLEMLHCVPRTTSTTTQLYPEHIGRSCMWPLPTTPAPYILRRRLDRVCGVQIAHLVESRRMHCLRQSKGRQRNARTRLRRGDLCLLCVRARTMVLRVHRLQHDQSLHRVSSTEGRPRKREGPSLSRM